MENDTKYGAAYSGLQLIKGLDELGCKVTVVVPCDVDNIAFYKDLNCHVIQYPYTFCMPYKSKKRIKELIRKPKKTIEHFIGNNVTMMRSERLFKNTNFDIIHCNSSRIDIGAVWSRKYKIPLVWHLREMGDNRLLLRKNYMEFMNRYTSRFIAVSESAKRQWAKKGLDISKISTVYNGVNDTGNVKDYSINEKRLKLIFVGGIAGQKGQKEAIEAMHILENVQDIALDIYGDGNSKYVNELKQKVIQYGLSEKISFVGYKANANELVYMYDCGLMCSTTEGFGRVTVEYMMAGIPVIASDICANKELIDDGITGFLYRLNDAKDLANKILKVYENRSLIETIGKKAREKAAVTFSTHQYVQNVYNVYKELLRNEE